MRKNFALSLILICLLALTGLAQAPAALDAATRQTALEEIMKNIKERYLWPEVAEKMNQDLQARLARQEYDPITSPQEFANLLTKQLRAICNDKHVSVLVASNKISTNPFPPEQTMRGNYGFPKAEILDGNIGYLKINEFPTQAITEKKVAAAMAFLANTEALIIDAREHRGGDGRIAALMVSYFVPDKIKISVTTFPRQSMNNVMEMWTREKVEGPRYLNKPVYMLTSKRTGSAGEAVVYDLQALKRVTVIGETTAGAGNPAGFFQIKGGFILGLGIGQVKNTVTGANWEGVGVKPEIEIPASEALDKALELARKQVEDARRTAQPVGAAANPNAMIKPERNR